MAYIGKSPAVAALTASDITDGIISTAKIADNAITEAKTAWKDVPFRNLLINGDMSQAQRATSTSSVASNGYHACDRFRWAEGSTAVVTISQDTDVPTGEGFFNSFKVDITTADTSLVAADNVVIQQKMEGQTLQHLKKGTSSAESLTLSFWVKSTKTGTYIASLYDRDNSRLISKSYTVSVSDTWEEKSVTFAGDTTGALSNDNGASLDVWWWLGGGSNYTSGTLATSWESSTSANHAVGQVNFLDSTSNNFLITGTQLEVGTTASDFEFLPYDVNLARCQRYYEDGTFSKRVSGTVIRTGGDYAVTKRTGATVNVYYDSSLPAAGTINVSNSTNSGWAEGGANNFWNMEKNTGSNGDGVDYNGYFTAEAEL